MICCYTLLSYGLRVCNKCLCSIYFSIGLRLLCATNDINHYLYMYIHDYILLAFGSMLKCSYWWKELHFNLHDIVLLLWTIFHVSVSTCMIPLHL